MPFTTPDWEGPAATAPKTPFWKKLPPALFTSDKQRLPSSSSPAATTTPSRLDRLLPPRLYLGRSRRTFLLLLGLLLLIILALGLGLGLGLHHKGSGSSGPLPLPGPASTHHTGDLTYYSPGPGFGACGYENSTTQLVCAVSHLVFDAAATSGNPNENPLCGRWLRVTDEGGDRSVDVMVVDRCVGCEATDVDLSPAAFGRVAEEERGRVGGVWGWLDE